MEETSRKIAGELVISEQFFREIENKIKSIKDFNIEADKKTKESVSDFVELLVAASVILGSSDIHIEPEEKEIKIRIRVDGILQEILSFSLDKYKQILSRIKLLSGIKLNVTDKAQDGRFSVKIKSIEDSKSFFLETRVSVIPSEYGESIVIRILNPEKLVEIEQMGIRKDLIDLFERQVKRPNGMIIVTGPTGSGKTTTLYAVLKKIKKPEIKIITIEDPVEYHLSGISQTEVRHEKKHGFSSDSRSESQREEVYSFASGLRAIVRQDPDVILVGEIRDLETAQVALQAALTGHLVLTTLHTNDAAGAIARLQSLGEEAHNIAPAVNLIIAQRLVRKICSDCSIEEEISREDYDKFKKHLEGIPRDIVDFNENSKIKKPVGCDSCNNTGYKGRVGLFEMLEVGPEIEDKIYKAASSLDIKKEAVKNGMTTIYQDGLIKILEQKTTMDEVERVAFEK